MKAIIENQIQLFLNSSEINTVIFREFNEIIGCILDAISETGLRAMMPSNPIHFHYGYGSSHMWVRQMISGESKQQVIFVEF